MVWSNFSWAISQLGSGFCGGLHGRTQTVSVCAGGSFVLLRWRWHALCNSSNGARLRCVIETSIQPLLAIDGAPLLCPHRYSILQPRLVQSWWNGIDLIKRDKKIKEGNIDGKNDAVGAEKMFTMLSLQCLSCPREKVRLKLINLQFSFLSQGVVAR